MAATTSIDQRDLIKCVRNFRSIDDKLKDLNRQLYKLREDKKFIENEMSDILKRTHFQSISKLEIQDDGSFIKIQRPESWNKPWSMSMKDLQLNIQDYFKKSTNPNAEECCKFIVENKRKELVSKDFAFTRVLALEDKDDGHD
ncbi:hypothetical protein EB118_03960 [bacterium]|nr:hypothetical protein [Actinomycetota bacterium]NDG29241.1 hypothetical protein [bacterium]